MGNEYFTNINPFALGITLVLGSLMLFVPRRYAAIPIIVVATYITMGQVLNIASFNFTLFRIMVLFGWLRLILRGEISKIKLNAIDKTLLAWVVLTFIMHNLLWKSSEALINQLGFAYNTIGLYFLFRYLIKDYQDVTPIVRSLSVIIIPLAAAMIVENITGRNLFAFLGGVEQFSEVRNDTLRSQGTFNHPILAGTFGASLMPLFIAALFTYKEGRFFLICGIVAATAITLTSGSIGPVFAYVCGVVGMAAWLCRRHVRKILWALLLGLVGLQLMLRKPVWHFLERLGEMTGGTGDHRSELIDQAFAHFDEWWLYGTTYTAHWMPLTLEAYPDKADITNQYIAVGVDGGIFSLLLFISFIVLSFKAIGEMVNCSEQKEDPNRYMVWSLGAVLLTHTVSFISVCYFDQIIVFWYLLLATISSLYNSYCTKSIRSTVPGIARYKTSVCEHQNITNTI